ncbi:MULTISPECIES: ATP-binding protein [Idiomarinaceae]|uniref:Sensor protein n=1 Tax=Pseudidiomarina fusca TaxID=2965078 RepID=A0ABU3KWY3_9GAMM|nr:MULTISPECIES: ATP-binding protein [Idiomarinaceae]MDT7526000.1 histidine kinase [Pseudidiomarina sp. GXY010]MRJ41725.1 HAMP domain-containing protein [Idiomarina sp. FeN1]NCU57715.1 HAMP domain-containing protein [Idiomarina sp. FenA--70]NCU60267.1 HAMP domain-containing protein [Idiomarina sp. FenBw--71]UUN15079.1 HAMP domain-containing protein [Idiomarina loihiensis]
MPNSSIVTRIGFALSFMVALTVVTLLASYWLSEKADQDALAINIAGSLRYQAYQYSWHQLHDADSAAAAAMQAEFEQSWHHQVFNRFSHSESDLATLYTQTRTSWQQFQQQIADGVVTSANLQQQILPQIDQINRFVTAIQQDAEQRIRSIRLIQVLSLFSSIGLALVIFYWLRTRVKYPLEVLTLAAKRIGQGDFTARVNHPMRDELGVLSGTLNKMNEAVGYMYGNLEKRVDEQTRAISQSNVRLQFLYDTARMIIEHSPGYHDFTTIVEGLKRASEVEDLELCLITEAGNKPYLQVQPIGAPEDPCEGVDCSQCVNAGAGVSIQNNQRIYRFSIEREQQNYGVLVARCSLSEQLNDWQQQLLQSVADQLAIALSLKQEEEQVRRLALIQERTVIARELHDSLAQALSYLKIQVTRLNKAIEKDNKEVIDDVAEELKQGLNAAYRQLRELLTTFRLKVDGAGLLHALQTTINQFSEQSDLSFRLNYQLENTPLVPHEEIHLLQIIREACQNAIHHSQGTDVVVQLSQHDQRIELSIEDNGVGIPDQAEKMNHYGLAIMQERSRHLGGTIEIKRRSEGGTGVYFSFVPQYLLEREATV